MQPLQGMKVLDFSHALAGPLCSYHLALLGADIIKIERPGIGDDMRHYKEHAGPAGLSAPFVASNAFKRSITLDLASARGKEIVRRLTAKTDVVVENFRPGVTQKLGIDAVSLQQIKPDLVYCSVTGFGQTGDNRTRPAYDHIVQAASGLMLLNGEPDQGPLKVGIAITDTFSGYVAAYAILAAIIERGKSGKGQVLDISMLEAALTLCAQPVASTGLTGQQPRRTGNRGFRLIATSDTYETADGALSIGANHQHQFEALCRVLGRADLIDDPRFSTHEARMTNGAELRAAFEAILAPLNAADLEAKLTAAKVPASKVKTLPEVLGDRSLAERRYFVEVDVPGLSKPMMISSSGFNPASDTLRGSVPTLGQDTDAVLGEAGFSAAEIAAFRRDGIV
jgi:crotonobetainyl-CoA:carnitine CoA-transferase CaiB-like acyl-CoA transferase